MGSSSKGKAANVTADNARIAGTQKYYGTQPSIIIEGTTYTPTQLVAVYQADLDAMDEVTTSKLAYVEALSKAKAAAAARRKLDKAFTKVIEGTYGNSPTILGAFGITVAVPKVPSTAVKAAAAAAGLETRKARHPVVASKTAAAVTAPTVSIAPSAAGGATPKS